MLVAQLKLVKLATLQRLRALLGSRGSAAADFAKAKGILVRLAGSMKTYDKKLDLEALQRKLAK